MVVGMLGRGNSSVGVCVCVPAGQRVVIEYGSDEWPRGGKVCNSVWVCVSGLHLRCGVCAYV